MLPVFVSILIPRRQSSLVHNTPAPSVNSYYIYRFNIWISFPSISIQESLAIAKTTARCALYIGYSTIILFTPTYVHYFVRIWFWTNLSWSDSEHWSDVDFEQTIVVTIAAHNDVCLHVLKHPLGVFYLTATATPPRRLNPRECYWFASASFSGPLLSHSVEFCGFVCVCVRNFEVKYLGNQRS